MFTVRVKYHEKDSWGERKGKRHQDFPVGSLEEGLKVLEYIKSYNDLNKKRRDSSYTSDEYYKVVSVIKKQPWWCGSYNLLKIGSEEHYIYWKGGCLISAKLIIGFEA